MSSGGGYERLHYPSDLNNDEWASIKPLVPVHQGVGHPYEVDLREMVNAILSWTDNGIKWLRCVTINMADIKAAVMALEPVIEAYVSLEKCWLTNRTEKS